MDLLEIYVDLAPLDKLIVILILFVIFYIWVSYLLNYKKISKNTNPLWGYLPEKRVKKIQLLNWFNGWANWKSGIYGARELGHAVPYIGHHAVEITTDKAVVRSSAWLYAGKCFWGIFFGALFILGTMIIGKEYLKYYAKNGSICPVIEYKLDQRKVIGYQKFSASLLGYIQQRACIANNVINSKKKYETLEKKFGFFWDIYYIKYFLYLLSVCVLLWLVFLKAPPPLVFDRKKRLVYTQLKGKLYMSDWDKVSFSIRRHILGYSLGFELYHLNKKGVWEKRWFTIAGHHYVGELGVDFLVRQRLVYDNRSHAMRAWLLLFMDQGELAVHPVLPFKGILDYMTPRHKKLSADVERQLDNLLDSILERPGDAKKLSQYDISVQNFFRQNNDLDLYDVLNEKNIQKYIAHKAKQQKIMNDA